MSVLQISKRRSPAPGGVARGAQAMGLLGAWFGLSRGLWKEFAGTSVHGIKQLQQALTAKSRLRHSQEGKKSLEA